MAGWWVGNCDFDENQVVRLDLDFDLGFVNIDNLAYLEHQQDDLLRRFIMHEKTLTPAAKCADCSTKSCKNYAIMASHKSFAVFSAYKTIHESMKIITIDSKQKIDYSYEYREDVETKFAPANSNKYEALKSTNIVVKGLTKIGKLEEF